jgi:LysR family transcriptional activator of nhaA
MEWLNYHHLLYFWTVATQGGVARAARELRRSQPTISAQIHALEAALDAKLFTRQGRRLVLTDVGQQVRRYADEIFALGKELKDTLKGRPTGRPLRVVVGIADAVPKLVARHLLQPVLESAEAIRIVCREDKPERLLAELALHELDVVLSDAPASAGVSVRAFSHLLGECGVTFFGVPRHAGLRRRFPRSLDGASLLVPTHSATLRRSLDQWFQRRAIRPVIVGEFDDSALLKVFAQTGMGIFAAPSAIESHVRQVYGVHVIGRTSEVRERYYAISVERRLKHPAVVAICEAARSRLFSR